MPMAQNVIVTHLNYLLLPPFMDNPYDLFLALLAPKVWGGVTMPVRFATPFRNALLESIDSNYYQFDDYQYVTGQLDSEPFRRTVNQLIDPLLSHIEQEHIAGPSLEQFEMPVFRRGGNGLQLARCDDAKRFDAHFRMIEPEYAQIKERFSSLFAAQISPAEPEQVLYAMGQSLRSK